MKILNTFASLLVVSLALLPLQGHAGKSCKWLAADQKPVVLKIEDQIKEFKGDSIIGTSIFGHYSWAAQRQILMLNQGVFVEMVKDNLGEQNLRMRLLSEGRSGSLKKTAQRGNSYATSSANLELINSWFERLIDENLPLKSGQDRNWNYQNFLKLASAVVPHFTVKSYQQMKRVINFVRSGGENRSMRGVADAAIYPTKSDLRFFTVKKMASKQVVELWERDLDSRSLRKISSQEFAIDKMTFVHTSVRLASGRIYLLAKDNVNFKMLAIDSHANLIDATRVGAWDGVSSVKSLYPVGPTSFVVERIGGLNKFLFEEIKNSNGEIRLKRTEISNETEALAIVAEKAGISEKAKEIAGINTRVPSPNMIFAERQSAEEHVIVYRRGLVVAYRPSLDGDSTPKFIQSIYDYVSEISQLSTLDIDRAVLRNSLLSSDEKGIRFIRTVENTYLHVKLRPESGGGEAAKSNILEIKLELDYQTGYIKARGASIYDYNLNLLKTTSI